MIHKIDLKTHLEKLTEVINVSFMTVANEFNLTKDNCRTNPAFLSQSDLIKNSQITYYGYFKSEKLIGCYALEKSEGCRYFLERLAVLPDYRHNKIGSKLVIDAFSRVYSDNIKVISIGIINENEVLKQWYAKLGFKEISVKKFTHLPFTVCFMEKKLIKKTLVNRQ